MFVLHPSSRCDVCLEAFSSELEMAPYAIPCGHVFCKACLESVVPPKCPMCRKNFDPARLKKLHVDRPEGVEDPREGDLLQRLAMSFEAPEEHRRDLLAEVDSWLAEKRAEAAQPLRKARAALDKYQELREMGIEGKREIAVLKQEMRDKAAIMDVEKERAAAIETNLLDRSKDLQAQVAAAQGEIEHLRAEVQRRGQLKNPLPPPPQPISLDRYAGFGPSSASSSQSWYNDSAKSMYLPSRGPVLNGGSYVHPRNLYPEDESENQANVPNEANGAKRDRKGKGRGVPDPLYEVYRSSYVPRTYSTPHPHVGSPKPKAGIIPGASPKSKFIPPDPDAEIKERGFNAFKPPDPILPPTHDIFEPPKWFDPARDAVDPWSIMASALPQYANGFAEGYANGLNTVQRMAPSGSRARDSDPDVGASESDRERQERRAKRRQEKEKERERRREREQNGVSGEHHSWGERVRNEERPPTAHRHTMDSFTETTSSSRSRRGEDLGRSHILRPQSMDAGEMQNEPNTAALSIPINGPSRRQSLSRPQTGGPIPPPAHIVPVAPIPPQPAPHPPNHTLHHIAQPTPMVPMQQLIEELDHSAEAMQTPASRRSLQSNGTADSWGTVSSLPQESPNSLASLNLRGFSRHPPIPFNVPPYSSPVIPVVPQVAPEEESSNDETETEHVDPEMIAPARANRTSRARRQNGQQPSNRNPNEQHRPPVPHSAPSHGSRHTQALIIQEHYQNPTLAYQRPPSTIQSASAIITPEPNARQTRSNRNRHGNHPHRSRHSASQVPSAAVIPNNSGVSNARARRLSFTSVPAANASLSSLSLHSHGENEGPQSANEPMEHDGYHTDVPHSGNALGLAISTAEREYTTRNRGSGGLPITAPTPIVSNVAFLRSFSHGDYD